MVEAVGGMKMGEYFKVPQKAVIRKEEKFLILKRSPDVKTYPDCWEFPGGKLEEEEEPKEGLKREVREETGLEVEIKKPKFVSSEKIKDHYAYYVLFKAEILGKEEIRLSKEHTEYKWATKEEILKLKLKKYLKAYLEGRR